jgi:hypothetical protein
MVTKGNLFRVNLKRVVMKRLESRDMYSLFSTCGRIEESVHVIVLSNNAKRTLPRRFKLV